MADMGILDTAFGLSGDNLYDPAFWYFGSFTEMRILPPEERPDVPRYFSDEVFVDVGDRIIQLAGDFGSKVDEQGLPAAGDLNCVTGITGDGTALFEMRVAEPVSGFLDRLQDGFLDDELLQWYSYVGGSTGNDAMKGSSADNAMGGGGGNDRLFGYDGHDLLAGHQGNDVLFGGRGDDDLSGGPGHDRLYGGPGDDWITGDAGRDKLFGGVGNDRLYGGGWNDALKGNSGHDRLYGDDGDDFLYGGRGNDTLHGGEGADVLVGGPGRDIFYLHEAGGDVIEDFGAGRDVIDFSGYSNAGLGGSAKIDFIGSKHFSGDGMEARFAKERVRVDMDGDGKADWTVHLKGVDQLDEDRVITNYLDWPAWF